MSNIATYIVEKMRVTRPGEKTAQRNPERLYTVTGTFYNGKVDEKTGKVTKGDKMTVTTKNVERSDVLAEGFVLDKVNGILALPSGKRGRTAAESLDEDTILAEIEALRNGTSDADESDENAE